MPNREKMCQAHMIEYCTVLQDVQSHFVPYGNDLTKMSLSNAALGDFTIADIVLCDALERFSVFVL